MQPQDFGIVLYVTRLAGDATYSDRNGVTQLSTADPLVVGTYTDSAPIAVGRASRIIITGRIVRAGGGVSTATIKATLTRSASGAPAGAVTFGPAPLRLYRTKPSGTTSDAYEQACLAAEGADVRLWTDDGRNGSLIVSVKSDNPLVAGDKLIVAVEVA